MKILTFLTVVLALNIGAASYAQLTSVNWGAQNSSGLGEADGTELAQGDLVRIGTFNLTDSQIQSARSDLNFLKAAFIEYDTAAIGDDLLIPAHWNKLTTKSTALAGIEGRRIYLWAFDAPSTTSATQHGIFTSDNSSWVFPADSAVPNTTAIDLEQVALSGILVGGFGIGTSSATGAPLFDLAPIPEPSAYATFFTGACLLAVSYSRIRRSFSK